MEDQGQSTTGRMEEEMMLIRLPGDKAVCVSSYWDEKECGGCTATVLFYADEEFSPPRRHSSCRWELHIFGKGEVDQRDKEGSTSG